ncbi:MAG: AfsR/SARP family transcriptional regulator [Acidimicrobiales bacterium]
MLGPLDVVIGGAAAALGPARQRLVLAALAVSVGHLVPADRLVDLIWPDAPPAGARHTLQQYVSQLRRLLEPGRRPRTAPAVLVTRPPGYVLDVARNTVDAHRFEVLVDAGHRAAAAGAPDLAADRLAAALSLWRGMPLADLLPVPFVVRETARLEELRLGAVELRIDAELVLGRGAGVVAELRALVATYPLRERLWGQLMVALYRSGRQAEALRAYQQIRRTLGEELGLEPGPSLRDLERAIVAQRSDAVGAWASGGLAGHPATR